LPIFTKITRLSFISLQDISNLAPRKPDWDLKRDVAKKLEKLQRRTQKAIAELIIERLKKEQDLAAISKIGDDFESKN
jgi:coiled-coil domain-containing protein 12